MRVRVTTRAGSTGPDWSRMVWDQSFLSVRLAGPVLSSPSPVLANVSDQRTSPSPVLPKKEKIPDWTGLLNTMDDPLTWPVLYIEGKVAM